MQYTSLGSSDIQVSKLCLGTMTFGEQNTESQAHEQLDFAVQMGINFIDAAEMYPVPPRQITQGLTERYIGTWLHKHGRRDELVLATKVTGPGMMEYLRGGPQLNRNQIRSALHDSLRRLQTDYIDLYQVHWPARPTNFFGKLGFSDTTTTESTPVEETLAALAEAVEEGKVRQIGISNETPWGLMQYLRLAEQNKWPRIVSIQNPYNLLNRAYEIGLAEMGLREKVGLLAYSPLAFGVLSGKYLNGAHPEGARLTLFDRFTRYSNPLGEKATQQYARLASEHGLSCAQLALAYINSRPFLTSNIIGATCMTQLRENIEALHVRLNDNVIDAIEVIHEQIPNPCP